MNPTEEDIKRKTGVGPMVPRHDNVPQVKGSCRIHLNRLWSLWYCFVVLGLQVYLVITSVTRFLELAHMPWPSGRQPYLELNAHVGLVGAAIVLLPFLLVSSLCKVGNLANDGRRLGQGMEACSSSAGKLGLGLKRQSGFRLLWEHGPPTAPFLHLVISFCLLLPRLLLQARLIEHGLMDKESIWKTDLDFALPFKDRLMVLSFLVPQNISLMTPTRVPQTDNTADASELWSTDWGSLSPEFINYFLALIIYAIAYPAVFWRANKTFSWLFSLMMVITALQSALLYAGFSTLYKINLYGVDILPRYEPFLLTTPMALTLYLASCALGLISSGALYFYGYQKFRAFLNYEKAKHHITLQDSKEMLWGYWPHVVALVVLALLVLCNGPLVYDFTIVYRGSLDATVLSAIVSIILQLFFWILGWLILTLKYHWQFELQVTVGRTHVWSAKSIKMINEIEMNRRIGDMVTAPLLVVGNGKTYTVNDTSPKKAILNIVQRATMDKNEADQVYWLKPKVPSPTGAPPENPDPKTAQKKGTNGNKNKVTFEADVLSNRKSTVSQGSLRSSSRRQGNEEDDGEYAILRPEQALIARNQEDRNKDQSPITETTRLLNEEHSLTEVIKNNGVTAMLNYEHVITRDKRPISTAIVHGLPDQGSMTPRSTNSNDSGLPGEDHPSRFDLLSSGSSYGNSPPDKHSESSSQSHHSDASQSHSSGMGSSQQGSPQFRRATSVEHLTMTDSGYGYSASHWRSMSLQRGIPPPVFGSTQAVNDPNIPPLTHEETLVIRRKQEALKTDAAKEEDPYGRCTNMRMTSFTDQPDFPSSKNSDSMSSLPPSDIPPPPPPVKTTIAGNTSFSYTLTPSNGFPPPPPFTNIQNRENSVAPQLQNPKIYAPLNYPPSSVNNGIYGYSRGTHLPPQRALVASVRSPRQYTFSKVEPHYQPLNRCGPNRGCPFNTIGGYSSNQKQIEIESNFNTMPALVRK